MFHGTITHYNYIYRCRLGLLTEVLEMRAGRSKAAWHRWGWLCRVMKFVCRLRVKVTWLSRPSHSLSLSKMGVFTGKYMKINGFDWVFVVKQAILSFHT